MTSVFLQKKEFYNAIDRRLDRVVRGALDRECYSGKTETAHERPVTYCCYANYCNDVRLTIIVMSHWIILFLTFLFVMRG